MTVANPREKLVHELLTGHDEEHRYLEVQRQLVGFFTDEELKDLLERHTEETRRHIGNPERVFLQMGQEPERAGNRALPG